MRHHLELPGGPDGSARPGHREDREGRAVLGAPRLRARQEPRPREDLEGTGEVQHLDVIEDQDADVPSFHRRAPLGSHAADRGAIAEARLNVLCAPATIPEAPSGARGARPSDSVQTAPLTLRPLPPKLAPS